MIELEMITLASLQACLDQSNVYCSLIDHEEAILLVKISQ